MGDRDREREFERETTLEKALQEKERRRIRASRKRDNSWFGLGMLGLVGWAFAIPMLAVVAVGIWLDTTYESAYSWSLMGVFVGAAIGGLNAWYWVRNEEGKIEEDERDES